MAAPLRVGARFVALTPSEAIARVRKAAHVHNEPGLNEAATLLELTLAALTEQVGKAA